MFEVPKLKFAHDALEPHISADTVHFHYDKHTKGYFDKTNELIKGTVFAKASSLEELLTKDGLTKTDGTLFNQAAQAWNHAFYWENLCPPKQFSNDLAGEVFDAIDKQFGTFKEFKEKFEEAGTKQFGSGWAWLILVDGELLIKTTPNATNPLANPRQTPLMVVDLWEHAFYLDWQNNRAKYLKHTWNVIDWGVVNERYTRARDKAKKG